MHDSMNRSEQISKWVRIMTVDNHALQHPKLTTLTKKQVHRSCSLCTQTEIEDMSKRGR